MKHLNEVTEKRAEELAVVDACDLTQKTQNGWVLREILEHEEVVTVYEQMTPESLRSEAENSSRPSYYNGVNDYVDPRFNPGGRRSGFLNRQVVVRRKQFLVARDENSAIKKVYEQVEAANARHAVLLKSEYELQQKLKETEKKFAAQETECSTLKRQMTQVAEDRRRIIKANQKMEDDIAKIRQAIGDLKMKEILDE